MFGPATGDSPHPCRPLVLCRPSHCSCARSCRQGSQMFFLCLRCLWTEITKDPFEG